MHVRRPLAATGLLLATSWVALGVATPAFAQESCSYGAECPSPAPEGDGDSDTDSDDDENRGGTAGGGGTSGGAADRPSTLPLTGGELVLLSAVGVGALVGGTALVVAGRRKAGPLAA